MTIHIADIASYQGSLKLADLRGAGFGGINVKISHGLTQRSVHTRAADYVREARALGMTVGTFHWLDGSASGQAQANFAWRRLLVVCDGAPAGIAHTVDVESDLLPPTEAIWRDYCATMAGLLGREIATYSGDWWWSRYASRWNVSAFSPWLWSAPRAGYLPDYPGDLAQEQWAGYGPWPQLAVMQYRVAPVAGINVSQSAVRSEQVWAAMRGAGMAWVNVPASTSLLAEFNELAPDRDRASDGTIGDGEHSTRSSDHNPDETGATPSEDQDTINEVHARDVTARGPWPAGWSMERCVQIILGRVRLGLLPGLQNVIYNGRIWSASWGWTEREYTGENPHDKHAHFGFRYGSGAGASNPENFEGPWGIMLEREKEWDQMATEAQIRTIVADEIEKSRTKQRRLALARLKERGWGGADGMSEDEIFAYLLEATVAGAAVDVDGDGDLDSTSMQARLGRIEEAAARIEAALSPPASPPGA